MSSYIPECLARIVFLVFCFVMRKSPQILLEVFLYWILQNCFPLYTRVCMLYIVFCSCYKLHSGCTIKNRYNFLCMFKNVMSLHTFLFLFYRNTRTLRLIFSICFIFCLFMVVAFTVLTSWNMFYCSLFSSFLFGSWIAAERSKRWNRGICRVLN